MKKPLAMRSLLYSGDLLAVDLGSFSVKVLHLKAKERSLTVLRSATREVWRELAEAKTEEEKTEVYAAALREILAEHGFKTRNASISLSGNTVIVRFLALTPGYTLDPETGLTAEAKALIPFDEPDTVVSALIFDAAKGVASAKAEMLLTIAQKKTVQAGMDIVRKAGLRPAVIVNDALALANSYEFFKGKKDETVVLVNIGATFTSVCVAEAGGPKAVRVLNVAGNAFTRALKREFGISLEESEKLKLAHGLSPEALATEVDPIAARVARTLLPPVKDLSGEIQRTIDVFLERRPADYPPIHRILLAGGSAELKGLCERLAADTGMDVDVFRPMVNVAAKDGSVGIAPLAAALSVSCGLGLSNTMLRRSHMARINLVPKKARRSAIIRDVSPGFWRLIAGPAIVVAALSVYGVWAVRVSHREAATEAGLEAAAKAEKDAERKFTKKKAVVIVRRVENPYAFLAKLTTSGVFGDNRNAMVMLNGDGRVFVARAGKLFDADESEVPGVTSEIRDNSLALTAGGRRYSIDLPK